MSTAPVTIVVDAEGRIVGWSTGAEQTLGYPTAEVLGTDLAALWQLAAGGPDTGVLRQRDGGRVEARVAAAALQGGALGGLTCLSFEVGMVGDPEPGAAEDPDEDGRRSEMMSLIAHDLRSPLSVVVGFADLLLARDDQIGAESRREALRAIRRGADRIGQLIDNVLEMARIDAGAFRVEPSPVDLVALALDAVAEVVGPERAGDVKVSGGGDVPRAWADAARTWQVISNLVTNAVSYSVSGQAVRVEVRGRGSEVQLAVIDEGPGIAESDHGRVFERFTRLDSSTGSSGRGSGLGLYICRCLVEDQGGRVDLVSTPGEGATFTVTLPAAAPGPSGPLSGQQGPSGQPGRMGGG